MMNSLPLNPYLLREQLRNDFESTSDHVLHNDDDDGADKYSRSFRANIEQVISIFIYFTGGHHVRHLKSQMVVRILSSC